MPAKIYPLSDGTFDLRDKTGAVIANYGRARDARRGASRRGFTIA